MNVGEDHEEGCVTSGVHRMQVQDADDPEAMQTVRVPLLSLMLFFLMLS
jgi:hypothetical protein